MDRGLWISWYNVGEANRNEYLSWLHEHYLPGILKRPGVTWATHYVAEKIAVPGRLAHTRDESVPTGGEYILLIGGQTAHAFSPPRPGEAAQEVTSTDRKMRALRRAERVSIMTEEARVEGPASATHT